MNARKKVHLPFAQTILQSHSSPQVALTDFNFSNPVGGGGGGDTSAKFDSISEIGYRSPKVFRIISEDHKRWLPHGLQVSPGQISGPTTDLNPVVLFSELTIISTNLHIAS